MGCSVCRLTVLPKLEYQNASVTLPRCLSAASYESPDTDTVTCFGFRLHRWHFKQLIDVNASVDTKIDHAPLPLVKRRAYPLNYILWKSYAFSHEVV